MLVREPLAPIRRSAGLALAAAALVLAASPRGASGQQAPLVADEWRVARFSTAERLPSDEVELLAESDDGTLWASTSLGLAWFDGWVWHAVPQQANGAPKRAARFLARGPAGSMMAVIHNLLFIGDTAGFAKVPVEVDGREHMVVGVVALGDDLLALTRPHADSPVSLVLLRDGRVERFAFPALPGRGSVPVLYPGAHGGAWLNTEGGLWHWNGTRWTLRLPSNGRPFSVTLLAEDADARRGVISIAQPDDRAGTWTWEGDASPRREASEGNSALIAATFGPGITLAVHRGGHLRCLQRGLWRSINPEGAGLVDIRTAYFDRRGDLWIGSGSGLTLLRSGSRLWSGHTHGFPNPRDRLSALLPMPGGVTWAGTGDGIDVFAPDGGVTHIRHVLGRRLGTVTGLARDSSGSVWVTSGSSFDGAYRWDGAAWTHVGERDGLTAGRIHAVAVDRAGRVWFLGLTRPGSDEGPGAIVLERGRFTQWDTAAGLPSGRVYAFAEGPDGTRWFGTQGGLSRWRSGTWTHWTERRGKANGMNFRVGFRVFTLVLDPSGQPWFGGGDPADYAYGLGMIDRNDSLRFHPATEGLLHNVVWQVLAADDGTIWAATEAGVSAFRDSLWFSFGTDRGLNQAGALPLMLRDDVLSIGTLGGGLRELRLDEARQPPPRVILEETVVDGRRALVGWSAFAYRGTLAPDLVETRFRVDSGPWSAWSTKRSASLDGLATGSHVVSVQAKGLFFPVEPVSAQIPLRVAPPVLLRPLVAVPLLALTSALVVAAVLAFRRKREHARERRMAQDALQASEERFATAFRASPESIAILTYPEGRLVEVNHGFEKATGWSRLECLGRTSMDLGLYEDPATRDRLFLELEATGRVRDADIVLRARDGTRRTMLLSTETIHLAGVRHLLSVMTDQTERRALQAQLIHAQKMEAIGQLAGGVAHDFNNLLTAILGHADLLRDEVTCAESRSDVDEIRRAATRAAELTRQLLTFARKQRIEPHVLNLNELVGRADKMLRRLIGERIAMSTRCLHDLPAVRIDPGQIEQVLVNLAVNARDAMPEGGKLIVETAAVDADEEYVREHADAKVGRYVQLSVSDSGTGIEADLREKIFEPFFTTKDVGKGTGLGLSICYGIIREAGGHIVLESEIGRGSTFRILLPALEVASSPSRDGRPGTIARGTETVLLVEDEATVRTLVQRVLQDAGYTVLAARDGRESLALLSAADEPPDLLLTDVMLPGWTGLEIAREVRLQRPGIEVLYMSGYTERSSGPGTLIDGEFLQKPFTPVELAQCVRRVLDGAKQV